MRNIDLKGKTALVMGVANQRSLAWAVATALAKAGARLAFTYQGERLQENVTALAAKFPDSLVMACDVMSEEQMDGVFGQATLDAVIFFQKRNGITPDGIVGPDTASARCQL